ncbi:hypothetical protein MMC34_000943 [Xylographa carneopallida]|nr:hypothetical protein [Xylographa carneopallida]
MIDHLSINTSPALHSATVAFYLAALAPLGCQKMVSMFDGQVVGVGATAPDFWIRSAQIPGEAEKKEVTNAHSTFGAAGV